MGRRASGPRAQRPKISELPLVGCTADNGALPNGVLPAPFDPIRPDVLRSVANAMERLDQLPERLAYAMQVTRNLEAVATTHELRAAYNAAQPRVSEFYWSLPLNDALWQAVQEYSHTEEARNLTGVR